ncbi:MAG: hypothetical protein QM811_20730 [Pirellulales bacterium]
MLTFQGEEADEAAFLRELIVAGFPIVAFGTQNKSLEDVFLHVTRGRVQ